MAQVALTTQAFLAFVRVISHQQRDWSKCRVSICAKKAEKIDEPSRSTWVSKIRRHPSLRLRLGMSLSDLSLRLIMLSRENLLGLDKQKVVLLELVLGVRERSCNLGRCPRSRDSSQQLLHSCPSASHVLLPASHSHRQIPNGIKSRLWTID